MNREKQIKEMAKAIEEARIKATDTTNSMNYGFGGWYAKELYNAGYRKASDVAREIFEEIERETKNHGITYTQRKIDELKKKYTNEKHRCHDCKHCTSVDESACEACVDGSRWESEDKE